MKALVTSDFITFQFKKPSGALSRENYETKPVSMTLTQTRILKIEIFGREGLRL